MHQIIHVWLFPREIEVLKIEQQIDSNGEVNYRIRYSEKDTDTDEFLWQTIYMPILNQ